MHTLQKAFSNSERETASWWPLQESADLQIARAATILALGKHPQAVTSLRAVEKMLVENYPIPRQAASRCGAGNFWHHPRDGFVQFSHGHAPAHSSISSCAALCRVTHANITMPAQWRIHLSPFTKDDRGRGSQWQQTYFWRAFAHTLSVCVRMQLLRAGGCWLQPALRRHRGYILDKTVLYTGSVFEYIRARRFQTLAQGQSRMTMIAQGDATMHELGDDCSLPASPGTLLLANDFSLFLPRHHCNTA